MDQIRPHYTKDTQPYRRRALQLATILHEEIRHNHGGHADLCENDRWDDHHSRRDVPIDYSGGQGDDSGEGRHPSGGNETDLCRETVGRWKDAPGLRYSEGINTTSDPAIAIVLICNTALFSLVLGVYFGTPCSWYDDVVAILLLLLNISIVDILAATIKGCEQHR